MKKYSLLAYIAVVSLLLSSCIKEDDKTFTGTTVVEIDQTVLNAVSVGVTYPILTRIPLSGRPVVTASDSTLRRLNNATIRIRVNLVGKQSSKDETFGFTVFTAPPVASIAFGATLTAAQAPPNGQLPAAAAATLTLAAGVANTHYFIASSGIVTIPANSSFGYIDVGILNPGATAGQARFVGIELNNNGTIPANPNYSKIGLAIDQR